jgi:hypothetical protein
MLLITVEHTAPFAGIAAIPGVRKTSLLFLDDGTGAGNLADGRIMKNTIHPCNDATHRLALTKKLDTTETLD